MFQIDKKLPYDRKGAVLMEVACGWNSECSLAVANIPCGQVASTSLAAYWGRAGREDINLPVIDERTITQEMVMNRL